MELEVAAQGIGGAREGKRVWLDSIVAAPGPALEPINVRDAEEARVSLEAYLTDKERIKRREIKLLIDKGRAEEAGMRKRALSPKQPPHTKPSPSSPRNATTAPNHVATPATQQQQQQQAKDQQSATASAAPPLAAQATQPAPSGTNARRPSISQDSPRRRGRASARAPLTARPNTTPVAPDARGAPPPRGIVTPRGVSGRH